MPQLTVQTGLVVTPTANPCNVAGDFIVPGSTGRVVLRFVNGAGVSQTVTLDDVNSTTPENAAAFNPDVAIPIPAAGVRYVVLSGARKARFLDTITGRISWTYSAVVTLNCEVVGF